MVGKVKFAPEVEDYLDSLVFKLYLKDYFGFIDSSFDFVEKLVRYVIDEIYMIQHKKTPNELLNLGNFYITYQSNQRTTWYILFDKNKDEVTVTYIFNNHEKFANYIDL